VSRVCARVLHLAQKFNSVKIKGAVANLAGDAHGRIRMRRLEFNINRGTNPQVGHAEKTHTAIAQVNAKRVHVRRRREHLD